MNKEQRDEIIMHLVNAGIAGGLVFLGTFSTGHITWSSVGLAFAAAGVVALTKFQTYWQGLLGFKGKGGSSQLFTFI